MPLDTDALERTLAKLCAEHVVPGAAIAIVHGDEDLVLCHGVTDIDEPDDVDPDTLFAIMSDTKPFTAYAAVSLAEQGVLDLDAPVKSYLPDLKLQDPAAERDVTSQHLLQHSPDWTGDHFRDFTGPDAMAKYVETLADVMQLAPVGTFPAYVNSGYNLLGHLLARTTQQSFADVLGTHVLRPHGLRATTLLPERPSDVKVAVGHWIEDGRASVNEWIRTRAASRRAVSGRLRRTC